MENTQNFEYFPSLNEIYQLSKIDYDDWLYQCVMISVETSNTQQTLETLPYYKFNGIIKMLNKYLDAKNNTSNSNNDESSKMMDNAKNMYKSFKTPKTPKFKK